MNLLERLFAMVSEPAANTSPAVETVALLKEVSESHLKIRYRDGLDCYVCYWLCANSGWRYCTIAVSALHQMIVLLKSDRQLEAIKMFRENTRLGLIECKEFVSLLHMFLRK